jgi:hypothetical protein
MPLLDFPIDMYQLRAGEKPLYGDFPDLRKCVQWFKTFISADEWKDRRNNAAKRFYQSLVGELQDPTGVGRFFDDRDKFGWYLFLGEAFTDHPWNYEVVFGCSVIPIFAAVGRNLELLLKIDGMVDRAKRLLGPEKSQPNGGLFEILVAAAYARAGAKVVFRPELPGQARTHDLDVTLDGKEWAVECKRIEAGEYVEKERLRMRELWVPPSLLLIRFERNSILNVSFQVELKDIPETYFLEKANTFATSRRASLSWNDELSTGVISELDLRPLQSALENSYWLHPGPQFTKLLTGHYERFENMLLVQRVKYATNPHYIDEIDLAVAARWKSLSDVSIDKRARDILGKLAEANEQLPTDRPGVLHIGFEALGDDLVEQRRYEKIISTAKKFDRGDRALEYIYCNYFAPEASPEETWGFDETVQWIGIRPTGRPLSVGNLVIPDEEVGRHGVHWIPATA